MLVKARNVHNFAREIPGPPCTSYCRFVLPSTPSPTDNVRLNSDEEVIDLRSPTLTSWAAHAAWDTGGSPGKLGLESPTRTETRPTSIISEPQGEGTFESAAPGAGTSLRSASVACLVEKAREGNAGAWEELVARFGGMIAATGRRYRLTASDVAELQQTTWLRLVENLHRIEQPERIGGWLATTARRESLQLLRRAGKYRSGADQMLANMPDRHLPEPDARPIAEEREVVIRAAWGRLKPRCQELLSLLMTDDPLGYKDLSKLLEMPVGSIGPTRARCLEHLRRLVGEEGGIRA